eukprot:scaffold190411_cov20-Prasinocladus_malaysianus.AAC.1
MSATCREAQSKRGTCNLISKTNIAGCKMFSSYNISWVAIVFLGVDNSEEGDAGAAEPPAEKNMGGSDEGKGGGGADKSRL